MDEDKLASAREKHHKQNPHCKKKGLPGSQ
jgi:hypothetical protein